MIDHIKKIISASVAVKQKILGDEVMLNNTIEVVHVIVDAFKSGHRVYFAGNGGSAADAQHLAAEFSGRFYTDRMALPAEALHCNTSAARQKNVITIGFTGASGGKMKETSDYLFNIPSTDTPRIQEAHILLGHIVCELVEQEFFKS